MTEVRFALLQNGKIVQTVDDAGHFAKSALIAHSYKLGPGVSPFGISSVTCSVVAVKYADGSSWTNPNPLPH